MDEPVKTNPSRSEGPEDPQKTGARAELGVQEGGDKGRRSKSRDKVIESHKKGRVKVI